MRKKFIAALLCVAMVLTLLAGCGSSSSSTASGSVAGTYEGTGKGRNGDIVVAVTLDDNAVITNIEVKEQQETEGVGDIAFDPMISQMVEHNSVAVDAIATATLTSNGLLEAVRNALTAAGVNPDDYNGEVSTAKGEDTTYDVDVAVVGAGGAGMAAAAAAAENGASVLVLEKAASIGGNTKLGEGTYNVADAERQKQLTMTADNCKEVEAALSATTDDPEYQALIDDTRADYEKWQAEDGKTLFDSPNWHALQTYIGGGSIDNIKLIRAYAEGAVDALDWLEGTIGVPFKDDYIFMAIGGKWARGHQVDLIAATGKESDNGGRIYIEKLQNYAEKLGTTIETNAKVTTLTVGDDGAVNGCVAERTDGSTITVNAKTVILATGGYAASSDLVYKYSGGTITTKLTSCAATSTGDGLALAENVGGNLINLDQIQVHPLGDPIDDCGCVSEFVGNWLSATEYMFVNKEGKRFINEDNTRNELIDKLLSDGHSVKADTLDELAEKIGVDADTLKATVETYNAGMTSGSDEFGKATSADSTILQAPFYASLRTPTVHYTMGGIQIDTDAHVLNADGNAIPGLYAAGEVASGIHGNNRLGGNAYPDIITFGRIAGTNAAAEANA